MSKQQTAVEWLIQELTVVYPRIEEMKLLTDKAKHMEKEQIEDAFKAGQNSMEEGGKNYEQYYNETYAK